MNPLLLALLALRAQLDATIALVERTVRPEPGPEPESPACPHPPTRQSAFGTPDAPMLICLDCGFKRADVVQA
jgi:hypothetical protein